MILIILTHVLVNNNQHLHLLCIFLICALIESMSFNALDLSEQEIVSNRKKLPFMTDLNSIIKVFFFSFIVICITLWQMRYKTYLYSNTQELVFLYHVFIVFLLSHLYP